MAPGDLELEPGQESQRALQRLRMFPMERVILGGVMAGGYGFLHGVMKGARTASVQYLAENAHRLPRTKGTWYFFHKRKNYVVLKDGINKGVVTSIKFVSVASGFLGMEATVDTLRGKTDALSTMVAGTATGLLVSSLRKLSWRQCLRSVCGYAVFGAGVGVLQDMLRYIRSRIGETTN